jgi:hypothetical protein
MGMIARKNISEGRYAKYGFQQAVIGPVRRNCPSQARDLKNEKAESQFSDSQDSEFLGAMLV